MTERLFQDLLPACWGIFGLTWIAAWIHGMLRGPGIRKGGTWTMALVWAAGLAGVLAIEGATHRFPALESSAHVAWMRMSGAAILAASTAFALWSRLALGQMWSSTPQERVGHQLRTEGPYAVTRHPIYTGVIGMLVGSLLMLGPTLDNVLICTAATVVLVAFKIPAEERILSDAFGETYRAYRKAVPKLVPRPRFFDKP